MTQPQSQGEPHPVATVANAPEQEVEAHRNALGSALDRLRQQGVNVEKLAEDARVSTTDVNELTHADLVHLTRYLAQTHPELLNDVLQRFPVLETQAALA